ncbi:glycosyltransferase family 4 protein [Flavobacterium sp. ZB4P13]|uniref:glycosyltransferase family 4 protein n=1 Tax=Flavobacterium sp. ZB4P13 TaxID=3401728 RepID=UPI003AAB606E
MKILMVSIPNHHFFQWANQLKDAGYEVYWFDVTDGGPKVSKISWVQQIKGWKLKINYPFRHAIKNRFPKIDQLIQHYNENSVAAVFKKKIDDIQPDIVHCFEMKLAGFPILGVMERHAKIKFIYSSWGSDLFRFEEMGISKKEVVPFFDRVNYLITDCQRDYTIALQNGFKNKFLGVFPGNGGIVIESKNICSFDKRNKILLKGYEDGVGKALPVLEALKKLPISVIKEYEIVIFSADEAVKNKIKQDPFFTSLNVQIIGRNSFLANEELLKIMGQAIVYIGSSISDGMPNTVLEAMGMGAFPIQSNPGGATEEVITHGVNGFLIANPLDSTEIAAWIEKALANQELRDNAQKYNVDFVSKNYNRERLKKEIVQLYKGILS